MGPRCAEHTLANQRVERFVELGRFHGDFLEVKLMMMMMMVGGGWNELSFGRGDGLSASSSAEKRNRDPHGAGRHSG